MYSQGIVVLAVLCACCLSLFGGVTDRLIPLYAVGAFLAFTLSQAGMVEHWRRTGQRVTAQNVREWTGGRCHRHHRDRGDSGEVREGAWVTALLIPAIMMVMIAIRRHYRLIEEEIGNPGP